VTSLRQAHDVLIYKEYSTNYILRTPNPLGVYHVHLWRSCCKMIASWLDLVHVSAWPAWRRQIKG